jgi:hypothetical protein
MNARLISCLAGAFTLVCSSAFSQQTTFQKIYGGTAGDGAYCVEQTNDGGYVVGGYTKSFGNGLDEAYLIKTDAVGDIEWTKAYGDNIAEYIFSVKQTPDGGYVAVGTTYSFNSQPFGNIYLLKTDANGDLQWSRVIGIADYDYGYSVQVTSDGGYIIGGLTSSIGAGNYDYYVIKTDSTGDIEWAKSIGGWANDQGYSIQQTSDSGYVIAGQANSFGTGPYEVMLNKLANNGDIQWTKRYGDGSNNYIGNEVKQTSDGGYVISGWAVPDNSNDQDMYLLKTDGSGNIQWEKLLGGAGSDFGNDVIETSNGDFISVGYSQSFNADQDIYAVRTDLNGTVIWSKIYGYDDNDQGNAIIQAADGGFVIAGLGTNYGPGGQDVFLIKTDSNGDAGCGTVTVTSSESTPGNTASTATPSEQSAWLGFPVTSPQTTGGSQVDLCEFITSIDLNENEPGSDIAIYPNPTRGQFSVSFEQLYETVQVQISNSLGQVILNETYLSVENINLNLAGAKGIYFLDVKTGTGKRFTKRLVKD